MGESGCWLAWPGDSVAATSPCRAATIRQDWELISSFARDPAHIWHQIPTCPEQSLNMQTELSVVICPRSQSPSSGRSRVGSRSYHRSCRCVAAVCGRSSPTAVTAASQLARSSESSLWRPGWGQSRLLGPGEVSGLFWDCTYPRHRARRDPAPGNRGAIRRYPAQPLSRTPQVRKQANNIWQDSAEK